MPDWTSEIRRRIEGAKYPPQEEAMVVEELSQHLDDRYAELLAEGQEPDAAYRGTLCELDEEGALGERLRGARRSRRTETIPLGAPSAVGFLEARWSDIRYSLRVFRSTPGYAAVIVVTLALGIGANTAIFSVVNAILLRPVPFADADRLVMVWETDRNSSTMHEPASWPDVVDFRQRSRTMEAIGSMMGVEMTWLPPGGDPERLSGVGVTPNLPELMGVVPVAGRLFSEGEESGTRVALVSESFWRSRLAGDPGVIGTNVVLNEQPTTIVGVLGREADLGVAQVHARANYAAPWAGGDIDVWVALDPSEEAFPRSTHPLLTIGRLAPGATLEAAQSELAGVASELEAAYPENAGRGVNVESFTEVVFGSTRPALLLLLGAVGLVLLVTCANVANMILVRATARGHELAVRAALGARGGRMAMQLLTESVVATMIGATAGVLLALGALPALVAIAPATIPRIGEASIDGNVLAFTAGIALLVGLLVGLVPMLQGWRADIRSALQGGHSHRATEGKPTRALRAGLVISQTALAVALVIGAGLLIRSLRELERVDPGFSAEQVVKLEYQLPPSRYPIDFSRWPDLPEINNLNAELLRRVEAMPGIQAAALASTHPLDPGVTNSFVIIGREGEADRLPEIRTRFISPSYASTLGVPLVAGRFLTESDDPRATPVAVLNQSATERYFPDGDPIGQQLRFWGVAWQVVGVMGDERFLGVDRESEPAIYAPISQAPQGRAVLLVRTTVDPMTVVSGIRGELRELDPQLALYGIEPLENTIAGTVGRPRFTATLLTLFGALAILLALVGLHGVLSYTVSQRKHEMGIRIALGAGSKDVLQLVIGHGVRLAAVGVVLGTLIALVGSRLLASFLFGVSRTDPVTFVAIGLGTLAAAILACWIPARRANSADPLAILRPE